MISSKKVKILSFQAHSTDTKQKLDRVIQKNFPDMSRRAIRKALDEGLVAVNGKKERFASRMLRAGDTVTIQEIEKRELQKSELPQLTAENVLLETAEALFVNKPAHVLSQPTNNPHTPFMEQLLKEFKLVERSTSLTLVHRLDKETTGVLAYAKTAKNADFLMSQFKQRTVQKTYLAIVSGCPKKDSFSVDQALSEIDKKTLMVQVKKNGKPAHTDFKVIAKNAQKNLSLIACFPKTGRAHQIRVHLAYAGHPIIGDKKYNLKPDTTFKELKIAAPHQLLHAYKMVILPEEFSQAVEVEATLAESFKKFLRIYFPQTKELI